MSQITKNILLFSGAILLVLFLGTLSKYWAQNQLENLGIENPSNLIPESERDQISLDLEGLLEENPPQEGGEYKNYTTPDGHLSLSYPSGWYAMDAETMGKYLGGQMTQREGFDTILFAQNLNLNEFAQLIVSRNISNVSQNGEDFVEEIRELNKQRGVTMTVLSTTTEKNGLTITARYQIGGSSFFSKERVIFLDSDGTEEPKIYVVTLLTLGKSWDSLQEEIRKVFTSVEVYNN